MSCSPKPKMPHLLFFSRILGPHIEWELNQHGSEICGAANAMKLGSFT